MAADKVLVDAAWLAKIMDTDRYGCPFCGSMREPIVKPGDETFYSRRGCLDCEEWWEPVKLKKP